LKGLTRGWGPTAVGFALQGACKFGFYELGKAKSVAWFSPETVANNKLAIYALSAAGAEVIGSTILTPWEAVRIRMVSSQTFANNMFSGLGKIVGKDGFSGLYAGLRPLIAKQVPYTVVQLCSFQYSLDLIYKHLLPKYWGIQKQDMTPASQLVVSTSAGVLAGVASAIASHPPDTVLSRINMARKKGAGMPSIGGIMKEIGFMGLWRGIGLRCVMVGSISAGMFLIYDSVKVLSGIPTTAGLGESQKKAAK
jgi:solute carrier family 25 phosphate transporter 3